MFLQRDRRRWSRDMPDSIDKSSEVAMPYRAIAHRFGMRLRAVYGEPEGEALPVEHVDLLLRLLQKERERARRTA